MLPITYTPNVFPEHAVYLETLWAELNWLDVAGPRLEYYCNDFNVPYVYGRGVGQRLYQPQTPHRMIMSIREVVESMVGCSMEVCFLNGYRDGGDHLGWHADDSPEMDPSRPIVIVSFGAKREIFFRDMTVMPPNAERLWLESGSVCVMHPGMQQTHHHKIPKASYSPCGRRISLTFRGYKEVPDVLL